MKEILLGAAVALALYAAGVVTLIVAGRREDARALAGIVPDCLVLFGRLLKDSRLSRRQKLPVVLLVGYLALPLDLIPDFIPIAGQLDDVILAGLVLRRLVRRAGSELIGEHWTGPPGSLVVLLRLAGASRVTTR